MKNILLAVFSFLLSHNAHPQIAAGYPGFGKLMLGESKSKFDGAIKWLAKYTKKDHEFNLYAWLSSPDEPVEIGTVGFKTSVLIFDDSNRLVDCTLTKFYREKDTRDYEKDAEADFKKITDYLAKQLGEKGEKKIYHRSSKWLDKGREWPGTKTFLKVKKTHAGNHSTVEISFKLLD